jgi:small-conductance mechanosensitive channel
MPISGSLVLALQEASLQPTRQTPLERLLDTGWLDLLRALLVTFATVVVLRIARNWLGRVMGRARIDLGTRILVIRFVSIGIALFGLLTVLDILGLLGTPTLVTIVGAVGLAFSLALQDILKNFFSGVYLLLERPFRVGDTIKVKDQLGVVEHIGMRTTALRTRDNVQVLVPNAMVFAEVVSNQTYARPESEPVESSARPELDEVGASAKGALPESGHVSGPR